MLSELVQKICSTVIWILWNVDVIAGINEVDVDVAVWNLALSVAECDEGT